MADPTSSQLVHLPDGGDSSGSRQQETERFAGDAAELARPIIEVRELVESFRSCHLVVDGWADTVREAAAVMTVFERRHPGTLPALARVIADVDVLLRVGWVDAQLLDAMSAALVELLPAVVPAGIPRPDDERTWAFSSTSST
jgi:hypothetical protein